MRRHTVSRSVTAAALVAAGCIAEISDEEIAGSDDTGVAPGEASSPYPFRAIAPCRTAQDYVSRNVVQFGFGKAVFTPPCVRLATGGTVVFQGPLDQHPLEPRTTDGSQPSPIEGARTGGSVEYELNDYGFFPYRCGKHPEELGVIWASWAY